MKLPDGYDKLRGGYYTPKPLTEFITKWAVRSKNDTILEPSCGDGDFLKVVEDRLRELRCPDELVSSQVTGVELDPGEARKAEKYSAKIINDDFFTFYRDRVHQKIQYDVIIGNPPFIRYQNFGENFRNIAFELMKAFGFSPNKLTNIWLPFLLLSCKALKSEGRIGFVIPAELFQVDYAAEARSFLSVYFDSLILVTFKGLVFEGIQQEIVLILGEKHSQKKGIKLVEFDTLEDLSKASPDLFDRTETKELEHDKEKWVKYYLTNEELYLLRKMRQDQRITAATDLLEVNVGLVTGENDFFVMNRETVEQFQLQNFVSPIVSRSEQTKGLLLTVENFTELVKQNKRVFFFTPRNKPMDELSYQEKCYIEFGENSGFNKNYKCRIRKRWYVVPPSWEPEAFLIRQANHYTKIILNHSGALVTDTLHKIRFLAGVNGEAVAVAFLNTYTLALAETTGRSYGGGVLTFEPGEIRKLRIPMRGAEQLDLKKMDMWQRNGQIKEILAYTDDILLKTGLNLSNQEIMILHNIWNKMRDRRFRRKNNNKT